MILIEVTHIEGIQLAEHRFLAIDPEKIVTTRDRDGHCELEYGESYVRNRKTVTYEVTANRAAIDATITGAYDTNTYLALTVVWAEDREHRPTITQELTYALDLQEKYIVDIESVLYYLPGTGKTQLTKLRYIPGSFVPVTIYVSNDINRLVTNDFSETTTTTTAEAVTTTTEEPATTTTEIPETTTTTTCVCTLWALVNEDQTLITWTWIECEGRVMEQNQEAEDPTLYVCSCTKPTCNGISQAVDTEVPCNETPEVTTTTTEEVTTTTTEEVTTTTTEEVTTTTTEEIVTTTTPLE